MLRDFNKILFLIIVLLLGGCATSTETIKEEKVSVSEVSGFDPDTVKAQKFDTGKMWTFEFPPLDYFRDEYNFSPSQEWLDDVRMSAVKFGTWCSASFVSEDGLIMTNNHCSDFIMKDIQKEGEDLRTNGFIANTLEDERPHPTLHVDQLLVIEDVTAEVQAAIDKGTNETEKLNNKKAIIEEIKNRKKDDGLIYQVVTLYNGGRYSLYGYKRYDDIRLVLIPESELGLYGGDPDNYTYPRYSLDFTFWRAYDDDGKPVKVDNYFSWSNDGANEDELLFVVGNPGNTSKLKTIAQLEYMRDHSYKNNVFIYDETQKMYEELSAQSPENTKKYSVTLSGVANMNKRYTGILRGLRNEYYMARKNDFEKNFRSAVLDNPRLNEKYGDLWKKITGTREEMSRIADEYTAISRSRLINSEYINIAERLIKLAEALRLPEEKRDSQYKGEELEKTINAIFPSSFDKELNDRKLKIHADLMYMNLGKDNQLVQHMFGGMNGEAAVNYALNKSEINTKEKTSALASKGPQAILNSDDPFIYYFLNTRERVSELQGLIKEINETETVYENQLGQALYEVYGTSIPPDGSFSLRISDGVLKSYEYNGTIAPVFTTFYGLYDRYYSHMKKFPWSLPERWQTPPPEFDLETKYNFISTHDIVGGSSGSAVINSNREVVGLAFDGNIESNSGYFIFDTTENRMISVASQAILEVVQDMYQSKRIAEELKAGRIVR